MRGGKSYKRYAGLGVAVVLFAGVGLALVLFAGLSQFPSSSPRPVRAGVQQQAQRLHIAARGGRKDGADARVVVFRGVGAALEQQSDGPGVAGAAGRQDQRRVAEGR